MEDLSLSQELNANPTDQPPGTGTSANLSDIEILKDRIEQQKAYKLKAEQLVSTLSKIKAREKATRRSVKPGEKKIEDGVSNQTTKRSGTNSSSALKEKSNLLKKKLEEERAKFEIKKGQDDLGRVSQIVEHIRVQLEDQDKTIQQMHNSFVTTSKAQLVEEVTPESDIPPEIKQKIADLEMKIIDLQENLREKDSVISARTQAITLLSEDMARKGKNTLDTLEETRCQMKTMQANFVALEDRMNEERTRLKEELESKKNKLQQIEKNYRTAESARYELSTRVAELQEKVVAFQTKNIALEEEIAESGAKLKELQEALESSNKQTIKMKAQFKTKLKTLEEERDALRKDNATNDELNQLRERIADLEDEKGNLQLHLVDFDEIQEAGNMLKERIAEMEEKLLRQDSDLDSHVKAIALLETQKLDLIEEVNKRTAQLMEKEETLHLLHAQLKEIEGTKISSEIKCLELEEKLDHFIKSNNDIDFLNSKLNNANKELIEYQGTINELASKLESKEKEIKHIQASSSNYVQDMSTTLTEWQTRYSALEEKLNESLTYCKELEIKKNSLEVDNDKLLSECNHLNDSIVKLNSIISSISQSKGEEEVVLLKQNLTEKEIEINNVKELNKSLETEVDNLRYALESTTAELHRLTQQLEKFSCTQKKVEELTAAIECKDSELVQTTSELDKRSRKLSEYKKFHKLKSEDVIRISHELQTVTLTFQQKISELETALSVSQKNEEILTKELKDFKENMSNTLDSGDVRFQEQSLKMKKLAANVKLKNKLVKDLEGKVIELEHNLQENAVLITSLENKIMCFQSQITDSNPSSLTSTSLEEKCKVHETEIISLKECLKLREEELESLKNSSNEKYETLIQIKELENKNKKLNDISETKSEQLKKMEDEMSDLNGLNKSLLSELEQMQDTYKQDALKNESVLESFEHEMLGNKRDILELSNQLKAVTSKYQQTWAKLQEKEGYIEELEQQLEKVKSRLVHIEDRVEEGRRSLEERAELLGARLSAAERSNEQLEKHEGELEHKITHLINTEEIMGNVLQKLQDENGEITKSLNESVEKNIQISKELEYKCTQIHNFTKEITDLKTKLTNYENKAEEYDISKTQLKETQATHENQIQVLKNHFSESEQCLEAEIQRLLSKVAQLEAERQDFANQFNSLILEKQKLEEELYHLQQTVAEVTREEIEQIKFNHKNLAEELNKELEKRQAHIYRIQELEIELSNQKKNSEHFDTQYNTEILSLKNKLEKELKENEILRYEIVKEKAKKQVDDVVSKAEQTYFTMTSNPNKDDSELNFSYQEPKNESSFAPLLSTCPDKNNHVDDEINSLKFQITTLDSENQTLKLRLQELEHHCRNLPKSTIEPDSDDWTAITKDEDDGWGWGSKDAMLEHEHLQKQQIHSELEAKVLELEQKSSNMEEGNKKLSEDLKASQAKCNKLLKKLKEFKNKSDSLERNSRERSVGFDDLDIAMQEELKCQVEKLEKNLKECNINLNALQLEREGLLKKIDVLTSGNERLVEMKERQDIEVEMWQRRSNELQNKVQGLEWTLTEMHAEQSEYKDAGKSNLFADEERQHFLKNALEMEEQINILAAENDYLQSLIVELKDKNKNSTISGNIEEHTQDNIKNIDYLQTKQENDGLKSVIQTLEQKENTTENFVEYCHEIEKLRQENELLSTEIRNLRHQSTTEVKSSDDCMAKNEHYNSVITENEHLKSKITSLNEELVCLKKTHNLFKEDIRHHSNQNESFHLYVGSPVGDDKDEHSNSRIASYNDDPVLFRGFTSSDSDGSFEKSVGNQAKSVPLAYDKVSKEEYPSSSLDSRQISFFDKIEQGAEESFKKIDVNSSQERINNLDNHEPKTTLNEQNYEISFLKSSLTMLEEENNDLKKQIEGQSFQNPIAWDLLPGLPPNELSLKNNQQWGNEVNCLNKKLEEQDTLIDDLRQQLNIKNNIQFVDISQISNETFNDLFSQAENSQESQVNFFVEQITQLTKALHDKEVEIEELNGKKEKYKEMYNAFMKEYDIQSNSDKEQPSTENIFMNQLFEDKETELEIMSQQIEQTIVAKENLQDELCLKLSEMEACDKTYTTPKVHEDMLSNSSQQENIEDVRTLRAEVTDLTKLLNEKESEIEILKQQLDEANLEKENLIDEWNKTIEENEQKYKHANDKCAQLQKELATLKDPSFKSDDKKQYMEELSLKNEQLTNAMNDLSNVNNLYKDLQRRLIDVETNLKTSQIQNNHLTTEVTYLKEIQKSLQDVTLNTEEGNHLTLVEKLEFLKTSYFDTKVKLSDLESEVKEKEKAVCALKERINYLEKSNDFNAKSSLDSPISITNIKSLSSEPLRMLTEQSGCDNSTLQLETGQGQVMLKEIQSLKQVLAMKDSEITKLSIALNDAQENVIRGEMRLINSEETKLKLRLDEALYTLHLRDVRCDELELELMQLLEERDSLQLRLSTAIRFNEELREKNKLLDEAELKLESEDRVSVDSEDNSQQLKQKLDQLHNVGYRRDPTMQQDQQKRYQEQMHLYTHDTSQDESQSSSGFFNWIFGASTSGSQDI